EDGIRDDLVTGVQTCALPISASFVDAGKQVADVAAALEGARAILVERFAEDADLIGKLREEMWSNGVMTSAVRKGKKTEGEKFRSEERRVGKEGRSRDGDQDG